jgi:CRP-like cAMP-binding protein
MPVRRATANNRILRRLPAAEAALIAPLCDVVELMVGDVLCEAGDPIRHAVFPSVGLISLHAFSTGNPPLALGLIGREGLFGIPLLIGVAISPLRAVVQASGLALRIDANRFRRVLDRCSMLTRRGHRYTDRLVTQFAQTAVCNSFHSIEARIARWMLATSDRTGSDVFTLKQSLLADMLGVLRPAVSRAARTLLIEGLVVYSRGQVRIVDRTGLEAVACSCYPVLDAQYRAALLDR